MGSLARKSRLSENIFSFIIVGLVFVSIVYFISDPVWSYGLYSILGIIVVITFLPLFLLLFREEDGIFGKYTKPQAIKAWRDFQLKRIDSKPTYTELVQRVKELERQISESKEMDEALAENEARYKGIVENISSEG